MDTIGFIMILTCHQPRRGKINVKI